MNLSEVARLLSQGELSQIASGKNLLDSTSPKQLAPLVDSVNLGLTALYTRFNLKEGRSTLTLVPGTYIYALTDTTLLKLEKVLTPLGDGLGLNDSSDAWSCFTPSAKKLKVAKVIVDKDASLPEKLKVSALELVFRANHAKLDVDAVVQAGMPAVELELPDSYLQALLYFIASRFSNPAGMTNEFHAGNNYFAKYEAECQRLTMENLEIDQGETNTKLQNRGFA